MQGLAFLLQDDQPFCFAGVFFGALWLPLDYLILSSRLEHLEVGNKQFGLADIHESFSVVG